MNMFLYKMIYYIHPFISYVIPIFVMLFVKDKKIIHYTSLFVILMFILYIVFKGCILSKLEFKLSGEGHIFIDEIRHQLMLLRCQDDVCVNDEKQKFTYFKKKQRINRLNNKHFTLNTLICFAKFFLLLRIKMHMV
jgi:hypothetical protein